MATPQHHRLLVALGAVALGACAQPPRLPAAAPAELAAPANQVVLLEAFAAGVQVYECAGDAGNDASFQWRFKGPEADLTDGRGRPIGKHYRGPTWESLDGSTVVAEVRAQAKSPDASAIPLLLLNAKANGGAGVFTPVRSIQRLDTAGGRAPSYACSRENVAQVARVPYTATYYFYGDPR
jgi:hypothetical protein